MRHRLTGFLIDGRRPVRHDQRNALIHRLVDLKELGSALVVGHADKLLIRPELLTTQPNLPVNPVFPVLEPTKRTGDLRHASLLQHKTRTARLRRPVGATQNGRRGGEAVKRLADFLHDRKVPLRHVRRRHDVITVRQHAVGPCRFGARRVGVNLGGDLRIGLLKLSAVQQVQATRRPRVQLVLKADHPTRQTVTRQVAVNVARRRLDGVHRSAIVVQIRRRAFFEDTGRAEHTATPAVRLAVIHLDHHQATHLAVDPGHGRVWLVFPGHVAADHRPVGRDGRHDLIAVLGIDRRQHVGIHPLPDAHVSRIGIVGHARIGVVEELLEPDLLDRYIALLVRLDNRSTGALDQVVVRTVDLQLVEPVFVRHELKALRRHVAGVLVLRVARIGARINLRLLQNPQHPVDGRADAVTDRLGLLATLQRVALLRR